MRIYQGLSPENLPLSSGRRSHWTTCKEDDGIGRREIEDDTKTIPTFVEGNKGLPRFRSPSSKTQDQNFSPYNGNGSVRNSPPQSKNNHQHDTTASPIRNGGDVLLQWGHRKRSRCSRTIESRSAGLTVTTDESSSSTKIQAMIKVQRRSISLPTPATDPAGVVELVDKHKLLLSTTKHTNIMPSPPFMLPTTISTAAAAAANTSTSNGKGGNFKPCSKDASAFLSNRRNLEERSGGGSGSQPPARNSGGGSTSGRAGGAAAAASSARSKVVKRSPPKVIEKHDHRKTISCSAGSASLRDDKLNNGRTSLIEEAAICMNNHIGSAPSQSGIQEAGCSTTTNHDDNNIMKNATMAARGGETVNGGGGGEVKEWPRVYIPLTRKEKEEDFLAMKGTKLPHRPKKRPKTVNRMVQYCFPGMWLYDVTRARYEVKEKKCAKKLKQIGGLKGMESMDSDSE